MDLADALAWLGRIPAAVTYGVLFGGALLEYLVPPVPGDLLVVAGAVLVGAFGWHWAPVVAVVTAGALLGSLLAFELGRWLDRRGKLASLTGGRRRAVDDLVGRFRRHGPAYLALNRFLPGIRALFFVAAGLADLRRRDVLLWSAVSALAWNALLVGAGFALGDNLEAVETAFTRYSLVAWTVVGAAVAVALWRVVRAARQGEGDEATPGSKGAQ